MQVKHSKYKNTGILFELLVRQITTDTLENKTSPAKDILQKYFVKSELGREYKLYESLLKRTSLTETKASITISTLVESSKSLNREKVSNKNTQDNAFGKDRIGAVGMKTDNDASDSIKPNYKGGSPLALETKMKRNKNKKMFNDLKNQKKQMIFEKEIKGSSLLDENQIK